jgi:hypothetical protein
MIAAIASYIGAVIAYGGAAAAVAFALFRFLGQKWIENKFASRLETYKHQQQRELEQLRFQINSSFDRLTKLYQHEFQVLPDAWALLINAFVEMKMFVSSIQSYPDVNNMNPTQFVEFVDASPFATWQKEELKRVPQLDRNKHYQDYVFGHSLINTSKASDECHIFLRKNGIFIERTIKEQFQVIDQLIRDAIVTRRGIQEFGGAKEWEQVDVLGKKGDALLDQLENAVQARLWTHDPKE